MENLHGKRVLVAMSGGVDSSTAAVMLKNKGASVIGVTMKLGDTKITYGSVFGGSTCCSLDDINDAREIAVKFGFPHTVVDLREEFEKHVIDTFVDGKINGITPNPCVHCNKHVKWGALIAMADKLDCEYLATGHYARIGNIGDRYFLKRAKDVIKDQTYFLWRLSQDNLKRSLFPLGDYTKDEVRKISHDLGLINVADKTDSSDLCFVSDGDYESFLRLKRKELATLGQGEIIYKEEIIGKHKGHPYYTIGQRRGLGVSVGKPLYVTRVDAINNRLYVGEAEDLDSMEAPIGDVNWMRYKDFPNGGDYKIKIRSMDKGVYGTVYPGYIQFKGPVKGICPGQSAVFYDDDSVVGGAIII